MPLFRALLPGIRDGDLSAAASLVTTTPASLDLASPWAPTHHLARVLDGVVFSDVFGDGVVRPVTRGEAMAVPAVNRARNIICGTVGVIPLRAYRKGTVLEGPAAPYWIDAKSGAVPAFHRMVWTIDDLLFYGWSCWARENSVVDGFPIKMDRIPMGRWSIDATTGDVLVADANGSHRPVDQKTVCLIPGPHEGILTDSSGTIRHAADLQRAASQAAKHPAAYLVLQQTSGTPIKRESDDPNETTVMNTVGDWRDARNGVNGGVGFIPLGLDVKELGTFDRHLLTEGRNAAAVDVARICSLPANVLDAAGESSLTYANSRDNDKRAIQYGVGLYSSAVSAVLSQDTVTPRGQELRFDLQSWLESPVPGETPSTPARAAQQAADVSRETSTEETPA